jgi:hypothetical protein
VIFFLYKALAEGWGVLFFSPKGAPLILTHFDVGVGHAADAHVLYAVVLQTTGSKYA